MCKFGEKKGFTLIELLMVVTIIAILIGIAVPNFTGALTRAKIARAFADMRSLGNAVEMYWIDNGSYPDSSSDLVTPGLVYITTIPQDPFNISKSRSIEEGALIEGGFGYYTSGDSAWLLVSNGPDMSPDITSEDIDWTKKMVGQLGGWEGAKTGYGCNWYDPSSGINTTGDLGVCGP
ncbi:prepilin-type N-terminal cleavage/methylation domain-containing protein [Candidatus Aerophobetes bacterium]|nr:prepilin-type N-terminal cleavage/methylation domain-containing protein [Candidatus Aerophobetes bacterium]